MRARPEQFLSACVVVLATLAGCSRQSGGGLAGQTYQRAYATFERQEYEQAERLALLSAAQARRERPPDKPLIRMAFECAGLCALQSSNASRALAHFTNAADLTDLSRDPIAWSRVQIAFASAFNQRGDHTEAERRLQQALPIQLKALGPEHPDTLSSRYELAYLLHEQRQYEKPRPSIAPWPALASVFSAMNTVAHWPAGLGWPSRCPANGNTLRPNQSIGPSAKSGSASWAVNILTL